MFLTGLFSVLMITTADAQRGGHSGGGDSFRGGGGSGGGSHVSGVGVSRGNSGLSVRGSNGSLGYRAGRGYLAGSGYHPGAFYRPGYGYYGYPHLGFYYDRLLRMGISFYWGRFSIITKYRCFSQSMIMAGTRSLIGAIPDLPDSAQPIKIDGVQYYEVDGVYYKQGQNDKGEIIYIVVGKDGVLNTDSSATDPNTGTGDKEVLLLAQDFRKKKNQLPDKKKC